MQLITLTSDFGETDYYVPLFKGYIVSAAPGVSLVDISNNIPAYDINRAAYILGNTYPHFPKGTLHIARVFEKNARKDGIVLCEQDGHYFLGPNNGLFSLILGTSPEKVWRLKDDYDYINAWEEKYAFIIKHLKEKSPIDSIAVPCDSFVEKIKLKSVIYENLIRGVIEHIDHYGNAITNIAREDFDKLNKGEKKYAIRYRRMEVIDKISFDYNDVNPGDRLARFNSKEMLEIAINCGEASSLLGLHVDGAVQIEFI